MLTSPSLCDSVVKGLCVAEESTENRYNERLHGPLPGPDQRWKVHGAARFTELSRVPSLKTSGAPDGLVAVCHVCPCPDSD
ncbi:hypothetical protein ElyMa_002060200 [Elysia marginata]|uniref:Uncharacterized protein n=1 Tax=Elysia marginata TaxID=1093978 RepID=A0AAV4FAB8_9GAST|nr:hypothetical protein ElyMa_002060200 [Elysia marginata]